MQRCEDDFERTLSTLRMLVDRNAAPVIGDGDGAVVGVKRYLDISGVPVHRFVDCVIDQFPYQMMKAMSPDAPDIHTGAFSDRFKAINRSILLVPS